MNPLNQLLCHPNLYHNGNDYSRWKVDCKTIFWDVLRRERPELKNPRGYADILSEKVLAGAKNGGVLAHVR